METYKKLPTDLRTKTKAILIIRNYKNIWLRPTIRAALYPAKENATRENKSDNDSCKRSRT